ncbi:MULTISPECIES: antibiotic biosynthesis monooxygenase [unclassified Bacillus (in: firmicutes)]|uniref:antibiotic biosynthesis monooxygenase family protein n=1 Tax=unclassified Bacillus (in: firmicutes) TaxID=185979 RepID=UPI0008E3E9D6|nr:MULTISPECIES: antibiotic biosynthesis monooxygenase [unclassified Bacillus (in: firmicutes)]SFB21866.1 Heme-degrading monooxygenase HmoA [Bacillus sp. UNCCL13]SFQ91044.1 Heme-degrading monooxygenase HmoA [Bacillus sp. cl95]
MYTVFSTFDVPDEKSEEVISIYKNRSRSVDEADGFVDFLLLQNDKRPGELTVQLIFETKNDYLNWVRSEDFKRLHDLEKKYPDQELAAVIPKVTQYKVVAR